MRHVSDKEEMLNSRSGGMESLTFSLQALLVRHESYMASAEAERTRMVHMIEDLERQKKELEVRNTSLIEENRGLLDQLEGLNAALGQSEVGVRGLESTLRSTQTEMRRLTALAARTEDLERQLEALDWECETLRGKVEGKDEEGRSAVQRWRRAEQVIAGLHDQVERIEREAREERERHVEVVGRMERTRAVERELDSAAGRLKSAAAMKAGANEHGPSVVSHFVKDILQDNANLQLGVVELREMLQSSNEEVERLREQLLFHQPLHAVPEDGEATPNLQRELQPELGSNLPSPQPAPQPQPAELHVHHHYHAPETAAKAKRPAERRVKRRRNIVTPGLSISSGYRTPSASTIVQPTPTSASAILSQTSVSIPQQSHPHRWSMQSDQSYFSVPSSPYANSNRTSSIFDRMFDNGMESSRPTSPESIDPASPELAPLSRKEMQKALGRHSSTPIRLPQASRKLSHGRRNAAGFIPEEDIADIDLSASQQTIIPEESEDHYAPSTTLHDTISPGNLDVPQTSFDDSSLNSISTDIYRPTLRRAVFHESLLSVSGMDIHTLQARPSQLLTSTRFATTSVATSPTVSATTVTAARPVAFHRGDSKHVLAHVAGSAQRSASDCASVKKKGSEGSLGNWVGGWVRGKWGYAPSPPPPTTSRPSSSTSSVSTERRKPTIRASASTTIAEEEEAGGSLVGEDELPLGLPDLPTPKQIEDKPSRMLDALPEPLVMKTPKLRPPGINQKGWVLGFGPQPPTPAKVLVGDFDQEALLEGLQG